MEQFVVLARAGTPASRSGEVLHNRCAVPQARLLGRGTRGEEAGGLQPEKLRPGRPDPPRSRAEAASAKHRGDGRRRDVDAQLQEFAPDPEVAPPGVLSTEPDDQLLDRGIERRTARPAGPVPAPPGERSLPPDQGVGPDQEARPPIPREQPSHGSHERSIGVGEPRPCPSSTKDLELVAEHGVLEIELVDPAPGDQAEQPAQKPVAD